MFTEVAGAMASFRIHEDHENDNLRIKKDNAETAAPKRRALGDLNHFACNANRNVKLVSFIHILNVILYSVFKTILYLRRLDQ